MVAVLCIALNAFATRDILRAEGLSRSQVRNQLILVWLVPLIGAVTVMLVHRSDGSDDNSNGDDGDGSSMTKDGLVRHVWSGGGG
jgi:hypothetical protein